MNIQVQNGQLPQNFCPADYQSLLNTFSSRQFVDVSAVGGLIISSTPPGAADHDKAWLQLDSNGYPVRIYFFANGAWFSAHPLGPGFTMLWNQALPNFATFDGGSAGAVSPVSGPMWQLMAATLDGLSVAPANDVLNAKFPIGVGTLPSTTPVTVGQNGGEEKHLLTIPELAPHTHPPFGTDTGIIDGVAPGVGNGTDASGNIHLSRPTTGSTGGDPTTIPIGGSVPTAALGHNTLPPYYGVYFLQRTNRLFYRV
jgi:hypothetical protein